MKQVRQKDEFHCVPACLEAILSDIKIEKSQDDIVKDNPDVFTPEGVATYPSEWIKVFRKYGIRSSYKYIDKFDFGELKRIASSSNAKILLLWTGIGLHVVGLNYIGDNGDVNVMDPALNKPDVYTAEKQKELNLAIISFSVEEKASSG